MKISSLIILIILGPGFSALAQKDGDHKLLDSINRFIDAAVIKKDIKALSSIYSDDFVFVHGTGKVDSKTSWLNSIVDPAGGYINRDHDSVFIEFHNDIAIVKGKMIVTRIRDGVKKSNERDYIRVFRLRPSGWQLISHQTTSDKVIF